MAFQDANNRQLECIHHYYKHLIRNHKHISEEQAACVWVSKYAKLWRQHITRRNHE